jgi:hypothetical protein
VYDSVSNDEPGVDGTASTGTTSMSDIVGEETPVDALFA